jgi:hypothetical protein
LRPRKLRGVAQKKSRIVCRKRVDTAAFGRNIARNISRRQKIRGKFMELKVVCGCGQKYAFDVEPVNGRMPVKVSCPGCGVDGTASADQILGQHFPNRPPALPVAMAAAAALPAAIAPPPPAIAPPPPVGGLRINIPHHAPAPAAVPPPPPVAAAPRPVAPMRPGASPLAAPKAKAEAEYSVGLGILGAFIGAVAGVGLMFGFAMLTGFTFPLMGTSIGILTGLGARLMARGTDMTLGVIAGGIALLATGGTLYFVVGDMAFMFILSMLVSVSFAYKIAG